MIGIFDSGLGGLTALKEMKRLLPNEGIVYFGDTGRVPYGAKSKSTIIKYANQDVEFLLSKGVDIILVACGTVSTNAPLDEISKKAKVPVIGVVEPAAEAAVRATKNKIVGVIGTSATIKSGAFPKRIASLDPSVTVVTNSCPLLVPLVENGYTSEDSEITRLACMEYLEPIRQSGSDTLILGCTHYPIISKIIGLLLPGVTLINTGAEAAFAVASILKGQDRPVDPNASVSYYVSDDPESFDASASLFLGEPLSGGASLVSVDSF